MKDLLDTVVKHQLRELLLVPPILIRLVRDPLVDEYDLSCLRRFSTGAAPLSEEILHLLKEKFPQTEFKQGMIPNICPPTLVLKFPLAYGMTESCSCITAHPPDKYDYKYGHTVGTICASTEIKIIDPNGNELGLDEPGEVSAPSTPNKHADRSHAPFSQDPNKRPPNHNGLPQQPQSDRRDL